MHKKKIAVQLNLLLFVFYFYILFILHFSIKLLTQLPVLQRPINIPVPQTFEV